MKKIIALFPIILTACTFDIIVPNQNDAQVQDAGTDQIVQDAANPNADLFQLVDLTQIYYNCQRFSTVDGGPKQLGYNASYGPSAAKGAFPVYMCSAHMNASCDVESLFVNEQSYYRSTAPTLQIAMAAQLPNILQSNCNLAFINEIGAGSYSTVGGFGNTSFSQNLIGYITQCSVDGGEVYMALMEFYNSEFSAFMSKNTSAFTFICN